MIAPTHTRRAALLFVMVLAVPPLVGQDAPALPNAVNKPTLNYLPTRDASLLFGGYSQSGALAETWLLRNSCWQQLQIPGPPARAGHAAAYDAARSELVLFGGSGTDNAPLGDTWTFDGTTWRHRQVAGPPARSLHRMTYEAATRRVVLSGGRNSATGPHFDDTWAWDGSTWREVTRGGPPARFESAMTYHNIADVTVLFGGNRAVTRDYAGGALGDTWLLRGSVWSEVSGPGPSPRDHHAMAHHELRGVTVLFGGYHERMLGDTWLFNGREWHEQRSELGPSPRGGVPAMTYDYGRRTILMYGGWGDDGALRDLWEWDGSWSRAAECNARD